MFFVIGFLITISGVLYAQPEHPIFNALEQANVTQVKNLISADPHCIVTEISNNLTAWQTLRRMLFNVMLGNAINSVIGRDRRINNWSEIALLFNATVPRLTMSEQQALAEENRIVQQAFSNVIRY